MRPLARGDPRFLVQPTAARAARESGFARMPRSTRRIVARASGEAIDAAIGGALPRVALRRALRSRASCCSTSSRATRFATRRARSRAMPRRSHRDPIVVDRGLRSSRSIGTSARFIYLPFEHSERPADSGALDRALRTRACAGDRRRASSLEWAEKHAAIVRRFGSRYPHRNAPRWARASTPERARLLSRPGSSF